mmetsp:Transcript_41096/g.72947  ORF Transcript_41096/g.72947 Transcript_41096/m.72947 type:complete len:121 (-) Transcript_41096:39-401(-)
MPMPMVGFIPPAPLPEQIRAGSFHAYANGLKKVDLKDDSAASATETEKPGNKEKGEGDQEKSAQENNNTEEQTKKHKLDAPGREEKDQLFSPKKPKAKFDLDLSSSSEEEDSDDEQEDDT